MRSGEEIQQALRAFAARWRPFAGTERAEAQTFLNELVACYGGDRLLDGALFEDSHASTGIMDMYWPGRGIVEMKAPHRADKLAEHRQQALDYWRHSDDAATDRAAPPYVVLCAFHRFEIWEPGRFPSAPRADFTLDELPDRYETLLFLAGTDQEPLFSSTLRELTREAADTVGRLYTALGERQAAPPETLSRFVLQLVWCLFAEDLGMLEGHPVQRIVEELIRSSDESSSYHLLGNLFEVLNDPEDAGRRGLYSGTRYVNGELFARPAKVHLESVELALLRRACQFDWRAVDPTIFGSLMEGCLGHDRRWELGAHYTHEVDIMKIVGPTIVRPWRERIAAASVPAEAAAVLDSLCSFRVLDPACGCGNFLYIAYRELRSLEAAAKARIVALARSTGLPAPDVSGRFFPLRNMQGIEIEEITALLARVTLWMGHRQMVDRYGAAEPVLPLVDLSAIRIGDALAMQWPTTDCIIGNPPFDGAKHLRRRRGDRYVEWLRAAFKVGVKDYCVYWFRRAHEHLGNGQRAGLVGTNSISQSGNRVASLDYIVHNAGVITDAVDTQDWPGEAAVDVSIVNWIKAPDSVQTFALNGVNVAAISSDLAIPERSTVGAIALAPNRGFAFSGVVPQGKGFVIE